MDVKIQSVKFDADKKLIDFVNKKMEKLEKFVDDAVGASVIMRLDKDVEKGNKIATIRIEVPGNDLIAENRSRSFEEALDLSVEAIKKQVEKRKER